MSPCALTLPTGAQTKIIAPKNSYSVADDVKLGREAAAEVAKELPLLNDERVEEYVETIGRKLAAAIPPEFQHPQFRYTFDMVNQKEINAFALPGGPMFLNRGMIEAAKAEGEVAGVMAHEISHVALRHGTAQATKGQKFQIGSVLGQIAGAIVGGTAGSIISQGTQFGLGATFLKYGREYESQADILGAQILARAGYDPREMANMFKTIEGEGGSRGPEWLSSHPNPGNRYDAINREAQSLRVQGNGEHRPVPGHAGTAARDVARLHGRADCEGAGQEQTPRSSTTSARTSVAVAPPSSQYRASSPFPFLRVSLPSNWSEVSGGETGITYAPEGGYRANSGRLEGVTHGFQIGVAHAASGNLQQDTDQLVAAFAAEQSSAAAAGRLLTRNCRRSHGVRTTLTNQSDITGQAGSDLAGHDAAERRAAAVPGRRGPAA